MKGVYDDSASVGAFSWLQNPSYPPLVRGGTTASYARALSSNGARSCRGTACRAQSLFPFSNPRPIIHAHAEPWVSQGIGWAEERSPTSRLREAQAITGWHYSRKNGVNHPRVVDCRVGARRAVPRVSFRFQTPVPSFIRLRNVGHRFAHPNLYTPSPTHTAVGARRAVPIRYQESGDRNQINLRRRCRRR
jgi:hypothetical protein